MDHKIQTINGEKYPKKYDPKHIEEALGYRACRGDHILCTYPKSGTWWAAYIIFCIKSNGALCQHNAQIIYRKYMMEYNGKRITQKQHDDFNLGDGNGMVDTDFRFMWTHLNYRLLPYSPDANYLIVLRNPKDVCVSFYYYLRQKFDESLDFHQFFQLWITGRDVPHGDYFEAVRLYWQHRYDGNCTLVLYEDMLESPSDEIVKIGRFLGPQYVDRLYDTDGTGSTLLERIRKASDFESMKTSHRNQNNHFRKGIAGDWRSVMTRDESQAIDDRVMEQWRGTGLESLWERHMKW